MEIGILHLGTLAVSALALGIGCLDRDGPRRRRVVASDLTMTAAMLGAMLVPGWSALAFVLLVAGALANGAMAARVARVTDGARFGRDCMQSLAMILMAGLVMVGGPHAQGAGPTTTAAHWHGEPGTLLPTLLAASAVFAVLSVGTALACFRSEQKRDGAHHASMGAAVLAMGAGMLL